MLSKKGGGSVAAPEGHRSPCVITGAKQRRKTRDIPEVYRRYTGDISEQHRSICLPPPWHVPCTTLPPSFAHGIPSRSPAGGSSLTPPPARGHSCPQQLSDAGRSRPHACSPPTLRRTGMSARWAWRQHQDAPHAGSSLFSALAFVAFPCPAFAVCSGVRRFAFRLSASPDSLRASGGANVEVRLNSILILCNRCQQSC